MTQTPKEQEGSSMAERVNDGGPAFPQVSNEQAHTNPGMTLRDWFAGQALVGIALADAKNGSAYVSTDDPSLGWYAEHAYQLADAMMAVRTISLLNESGNPKHDTN